MIDLHEHSSAMLLELERQISDPLQTAVVLDLAETAIISSYFVNQLIRINLRLRMTERRLVLINVQPTVCEVLKLLRLDRTFDYEPVPICEGIEQASSAIRQRFDAPKKLPLFF